MVTEAQIIKKANQYFKLNARRNKLQAETEQLIAEYLGYETKEDMIESNPDWSDWFIDMEIAGIPTFTKRDLKFTMEFLKRNGD